jgi:cytochrome bd ubiquinol oxidase subunit I
MDVELLSRLQFAGMIMFHYLFPPLSIGLGLQLFLCKIAYSELATHRGKWQLSFGHVSSQ